MIQIKELVIPVGPWILITRANGYVASHMADKSIQLGYNACGSVSNLDKAIGSKTCSIRLTVTIAPN